MRNVSFIPQKKYPGSLPAGKSLVEVDEGEAITDIIDLDLLDRLVTGLLAHIQGLHVGLDVLLAGQLQHALHLGAGADMARGHAAAVGHKGHGVELGEGFVGQADVVEDAVDGERGHVFGQVEGVRHVGGVEDEVKGKRPRFRPVLVLRADEPLGPQRERFVLFVRAVRDRVRFRSQGRRPQKTEVPETATSRLEKHKWWKNLGCCGHWR